MTTMLPYIGTKNVLARPMTRGAYNEYQGWIIPHDQDPEDEGYLIEYLDGGKGNHPKHENYISWSPKDVFERSYVQQPAPFTATGHVEEDVPVDENGFASFILKNPIKAKAMTLGQFSEIYYSPNPLADANTEGFAVQVSTADGGFAIEFLTEGEFASQYKLQGAVGFIVNVDETPFIKPMSISKMEPLENGMALGTIEQLSNVNGQLDFSDALRALKFGYRVQRSGWNAKDQWLAVSNPESAVVDAANFWSPHSRAYAERNGGSAVVPPCILIKNAQGEIQMGWAPSPGDMFANDWVVIEEAE